LFVASLPKIPLVMSLSNIPFVVSLSKIPFVVSLSNHALGAEAKSPPISFSTTSMNLSSHAFSAESGLS
jgi:hypothetical protein